MKKEELIELIKLYGSDQFKFGFESSFPGSFQVFHEADAEKKLRIIITQISKLYKE